MFLRHFKMTAHPFAEKTPVEWLVRDERFAQGLARLEYFASEGTCALVIGQTGVGKSSLLRLMMHGLSPNRYRPIYVHLTHVNATALLRLLVSRLGERPRRGKERLFMQIMDRAGASDLTTLLILDEAHLIDPDALVDLRLLISGGGEEASRLKLVLCGQESLRDVLRRASHADLVHRISVRWHLYALTKEQSASYIDSRMRRAGASERVFDAEAKGLIHDYAGGVPRQINNMATACLINAATRNLQKIGEELVNETMREFRMG